MVSIYLFCFIPFYFFLLSFYRFLVLGPITNRLLLGITVNEKLSRIIRYIVVRIYAP